MFNASDYRMVFTQHTRQVLDVVSVVCQETVKDSSQCRYAYIQVGPFLVDVVPDGLCDLLYFLLFIF